MEVREHRTIMLCPWNDTKYKEFFVPGSLLLRKARFHRCKRGGRVRKWAFLTSRELVDEGSGSDLSRRGSETDMPLGWKTMKPS